MMAWGRKDFLYLSIRQQHSNKIRKQLLQVALKAQEEDEEERQEVSASLAAAKETSAGAAAVGVLSELDVIFT